MTLENLRWKELEKVAARVFIVPLGSLEQHGYHLPLATDSIIIGELVKRIERELADEIVLAPVQWLGHSPHHTRFGCVSLDLRPYMEMVIGMCRSLAAMGARRILLLNGHGGNDVPCRAAMRELKSELGRDGPAIAFASYWTLAAADFAKIRSSPRGGMGHACEMETSIMLVLRPELVATNDAVDDGTFGRGPYQVLDMLQPQPYYMVREFDELSASGTLGMPSHASAEKGEEFLAAAVAACIRFIREFAIFPTGDSGAKLG